MDRGGDQGPHWVKNLAKKKKKQEEEEEEVSMGTVHLSTQVTMFRPDWCWRQRFYLSSGGRHDFPPKAVAPYSIAAYVVCLDGLYQFLRQSQSAQPVSEALFRNWDLTR
jgi:hypothetical protein